MTDSPAYRQTLDPQEQPVLDSLLSIRDKLLLLKSDKSKYVKSQDVLTLYDEILEQTSKVNAIRLDRPNEQNRLDSVLHDCFQLISLFFLTIGRNNEAPAAYSVVSTIKRLLDHLKEAGFFTGKDLSGICHNLQKVQESIERGRSCHDAQVLKLLEARMENCYTVVRELKESLKPISADLLPTHEKLVSMLRTISGLNTKKKYPINEIKDIQTQLREIEANFEGHPEALPPSEHSAEERYAYRIRHMSVDKDATTDGRDLCVGLLGRCLLWADICLSRQGKLDEHFRDLFDELFNIKSQLDKLSMTQAWSLRETDLYGYQRKLDRIDDMRVDGNFLDGGNRPADIYNQRTLLYLLRKSYAEIYFMMTNSEPVSEALLPIYNQLMTLRRCLVEVKKAGGVSSPRELYPYSMKLNSIDNMREDGKFVVNSDIPEGQGSVTALLSECFDLAYDLRMEAEAEAEESDNDDDSHGGPQLSKDATANAAAVNVSAPQENGVSIGVN